VAVPLADAYLADIAARIGDLRRTAAAPLERAVEAMLAAVRADGLIHVFGTGHSHLLAEEAHFRAGGLAPVVPWLAPAVMLQDGAAAGGRLERLPGLVAALFADRPIGPRDVLVVVSNSGVNAAPVEAAEMGRARGATVIALTSEVYSRAAAQGRRRIADIADIVLDTGAPPGDAGQETGPGGPRVGPVSTVIGAALLNAALAETARRLVAEAGAAPVYLSANMPGAAERNAALVTRWRPRNPHL
jgi:uncharacterized phosphosugar-binding protein